MPFLQSLCLLLVFPNLLLASKYVETVHLQVGGRFGPVMEGPMYSIPGFVGIVKYTPLLGFTGTAKLNVPLKAVRTTLGVLFTSASARLPMFDDASQTPQVTLCYDNGSVTAEAMNAFGDYNDYYEVILTGGNKPLHVDVRTDVRTNGWQHMTFILCQIKGPIATPGDHVGDIEVVMQGTIIFQNPYGYLPGASYGYLPFMGILSTIYFIMLVLFTFLACKHRRTILRMQVGIWAVILMGFIETTTWFLTYNVMNDSGGGACCPWRSDLIFAICTNDMKRTVSAALVLAVALGWGVVEPRLARRTTLIIVFVSTLYLGVSLKYDLIRMQIASRPDASSDQAQAEAAAQNESNLWWALALAVLDVVLIFWIYTALNTTMRTLTDNHETHKLEMYNRLSRTLRLWVILWIIFTFFDILIQGSLIPWPWTLTFMLTGFWDLLYLGVLVTMARIWLPNENSDRYAYSAQLPTDNVLDDFDHEAFEQAELEDGRELEEIGVTTSSSSNKPKRELAIL